MPMTAGNRVSLKCRARRVLGCCLLLMTTFAWAATPAPLVTLLLSEPGGIYQAAAEQIRVNLLEIGEPTVQIKTQALSERTGPGGETLLVALGVKALQTALATRGDAPVLVLMTPRQSFEALVGDHAFVGKRRVVTAIWLEQPYARQLALLRAALPRARRVGVLAGPANQGAGAELARAAETLSMHVVPRSVGDSEEVFAAMADFANQVDALLLLPDPVVVNRATLQTLMLNTYRQRLPVLAYSESLSRSGALLALFATPEQIGQEGASTIRALFRRGDLRLSPPTYPRAFTMKVNRSVARALAIELPAEKELEARLEATP
ncbi:MAG: ABC transporter substrate binding protein [Pseudomonadota bacterium]|nr:ABC transporter substrate binding protein [Pseudomonadota bacterium]